MGKLSENFFKQQKTTDDNGKSTGGSLARGFYKSRGQDYDMMIAKISEKRKKDEEERIRISKEISDKELAPEEPSVFSKLLAGGKALGGALYEGFKTEYLPKIQNKAKILKDTLIAEGRLVSGVDLTNPEQLKKDIQQNVEFGKGLIKDAGNLASGLAKTGVKYNPAVGLVNSTTNVYSKLTGKENPVESFIDNNGILNYKPEYSNEIQKTGGDVGEIASWFIPITRAGKVAKIEQALKELPKVAQFIGSKPKIVQSGGKFFYEVAKDVVDVGVLDTIRGKSWEEISEDIKSAGAGGTILRGTGKVISSIFEKSKTNKIVSTVKKAFGDLTDEEMELAKEGAKGGKPIDEIYHEINSLREPTTSRLNPEEVPIKDLKSIEGDREMAVADFKAGKKSKTDLPVLVRKEKDGTMTVLDGNGRIVQAQEDGLDTIQVTTNEKEYRKILEEREAKIKTNTSTEDPPGTKKTESPIAKKVNTMLDKASQVDETLPTTSFKKEFASVAKRIEADPKKAYNDFVYGSKESDVTRSAGLISLLENAKSKGDLEAISEIGMAAARHGRKSGQEVVMFRSLYEADPMNKLLVDFANTKLHNIETRYPKFLKKMIKGEEGDIVTATVKAIKKKTVPLKDAQSIINAFICK